MTLAVHVMSLAVFTVMIAYAVRHYRFLWNRLYGRQDRAYQDLAGVYLPSVTIVVPMHNEAAVARSIITHLMESDYPQERFEVIAVDDHSLDHTGVILEELAMRYPRLKVVRRRGREHRGKAYALGDATAEATGEILLVFDADYRPGRDVLKRLVAPFCDPSVAAVMGRVVPINSGASFLTRLLDLERSGGYQADQQARHNLGLMVQYGGTVGGVRRSVLRSVGGWQPHLTEDTDLTMRIYLRGFRVIYVNLAECYEEVPQRWEDRSRQLRRWAIGHNNCLFDYLVPVLFSPMLRFRQKVDGLMLLGVYVAPVALLVGWLSSIYLYFVADIWYWTLFVAGLATMTYNGWGNLAVFTEMGGALLLDRRHRSALLLPLGTWSFFANVWICSGAFVRALRARILPRRVVQWDKTKRYAGGPATSLATGARD